MTVVFPELPVMAIILPLFLFLENFPKETKDFNTSFTITTFSLNSSDGAFEIIAEAPFLIAEEIN